nr:MAG: ORF1 [TTV-like mini virus]
MPWRRTYYRRYYRPPRRWRFRRSFRRRRYTRRHWVRRPKYKRKLKRLYINEYQPKSIRKCKIKGLLCLFQTSIERICYNFDMYEESIVPDRLPGGGGFSIKNLSLQSLYLENTHGHNIFTKSNEPYPLCRYLGCQLKLFRSNDIDYIISYNNQWPLQSNLKMYNSMQPQIHLLQQNRIIVQSKKTAPNKKKPYKKVFIPPPTQLKNQWYFQSQIANTPLFMLMTSSCSLDHWYIGTRNQSTNITITSLNTKVIFHRNWDKGNIQYYCHMIGTQPLYLYAADHPDTHIIDEIDISDIICLGNTQENVHGMSFKEYKTLHKETTFTKQTWKQHQNWGNPFHKDYLTNNNDFGDYLILASTTNINDFTEKLPDSPTTKKTIKQAGLQMNPIEITTNLRYNPYKDDGTNNQCYFLSCKQPGGRDWDAPSNPDLTNENLPLWLLLYGFSDFQKKIAKLKHIDTDYTFVIKTQKTNPLLLYVVPIGISMTQGFSPYEKQANFIDHDKWFPSFQFQQESYTNICLSGPGTPHIEPGVTTEAKIQYKFFFKWGGEIPEPDTTENPSDKPYYPIPNNILSTTSLQNPTQAPEYYLYSFDTRKDMLTKKAAQRLKKDWGTEKTTFSITEPRFSETTQIQTPQEETTSEEEEEEDLYHQLQLQRHKQHKLKQRIRLILQQIQNIE